MDSGSTRKLKGITGAVRVGLDDISFGGRWSMLPWLTGELLQVFTESGAARVSWRSDWQNAQPGTWYQATFPMPTVPPAPRSADRSILLLLTFCRTAPFCWTQRASVADKHTCAFVFCRFSLLLSRRGCVCPQVNGFNIGRYFLVEGDNSGLPTQWLYHIPPDALRPGTNTLTLFEEVGTQGAASSGVKLFAPDKARIFVSRMAPI